MNQQISPDQQRLIIEKLYRSTDSITSLKKFNEEYLDKVRKMGEKTLSLGDFAREMKNSSFSSFDIERFTKDITGYDMNMEDY